MKILACDTDRFFLSSKLSKSLAFRPLRNLFNKHTIISTVCYWESRYTCCSTCKYEEYAWISDGLACSCCWSIKRRWESVVISMASYSKSLANKSSKTPLQKYLVITLLTSEALQQHWNPFYPIWLGRSVKTEELAPKYNRLQQCHILQIVLQLVTERWCITDSYDWVYTSGAS